MRAALITELGSPPRPAEHPDVPAGVEVVAVALNPVDIVARGRISTANVCVEGLQ